jgi:hypothetical protein
MWKNRKLNKINSLLFVATMFLIRLCCYFIPFRKRIHPFFQVFAEHCYTQYSAGNIRVYVLPLQAVNFVLFSDSTPACMEQGNTERFIMFSVITNFYNKKNKGPTLMELNRMEKTVP